MLRQRCCFSLRISCNVFVPPSRAPKPGLSLYESFYEYGFLWIRIWLLERRVKIDPKDFESLYKDYQGKEVNVAEKLQENDFFCKFLKPHRKLRILLSATKISVWKMPPEWNTRSRLRQMALRVCGYQGLPWFRDYTLCVGFADRVGGGWLVLSFHWVRAWLNRKSLPPLWLARSNGQSRFGNKTDIFFVVKKRGRGMLFLGSELSKAGLVLSLLYS